MRISDHPKASPSTGLRAPGLPRFSTRIWIIAVATSARPSDSWTVRMWAPNCSRCAAGRWHVSLTDGTIGSTVARIRETDRITITLAANSEGAAPGVLPYWTKHRTLHWPIHRPRRPDNHAALYGRCTYAADARVASRPVAVQ